MWRTKTERFWMYELPSGFWHVYVDGKEAVFTAPDVAVDEDDLIVGIWKTTNYFFLAWKNEDGHWIISASEEPEWEG